LFGLAPVADVLERALQPGDRSVGAAHRLADRPHPYAAAARGDEPELFVVGRAVAQAGFDQAAQLAARFRREVSDRFLDRGRGSGRHLVDAAHFVRPDHAALRRVIGPAADVRDTACHLQQPRIELGFALAPHLFGHVLDRAQVVPTAVVRTQQLGAGTHVPLLARRAHDPVPDIEPRPAAQRRVHRLAHVLPFVRVHELQEVVQAPGGRSEAVDGAGGVRQGERHGARVHFPETEVAWELADVRRII
jgi:hypothetical protein